MVDYTSISSYLVCAMRTKYISNKTNFIPPDPAEDIVSVPRPIVAMAKEFPSGHLIPYLPESIHIYPGIRALVACTRDYNAGNKLRDNYHKLMKSRFKVANYSLLVSLF